MSSTIEKISEDALLDVSGELDRLLGVRTDLTLRSGGLVKCEDFIQQLEVGTVLVRLELAGGGDGKGMLAVSKRNAIRMAGKLLMLPVPDVNRCIADGSYANEYQYAYGEIVKCFVGAFVQSLPRTGYKYAEIRCGTQEFVEGGDPGSSVSEMLPDQPYYLARISLVLADVPQDDILLLLPAIMVLNGCDEGTGRQKKASPAMIVDPAGSANGAEYHNPPGNRGTAIESTPFIEFLHHWLAELNRDIGSSFGVLLEKGGTSCERVGGNQIRELVIGNRMLLTSYCVDGLVDGTVTVNCCFEDVMRIGSILVGEPEPASDFPDSEILSESDRQDGFNELNAMIFTNWADTLADTEPGTIAVRKDHSVLLSDIDGQANPAILLSEQNYLMFSLLVKKEGKLLGYINFLFPDSFVEQLDSIVPDSSVTVRTGRSDGEIESTIGDSGRAGGKRSKGIVRGERFLIISSATSIAGSLCDLFEQEGFSYDLVSTDSESLQDMLADAYHSVFLVVGRPDEMALSNIIKINSLSTCPLVVAAPEWTQSQVVKALRYGAADIALTPLDGKELTEKIERLRAMMPI